MIPTQPTFDARPPTRRSVPRRISSPAAKRPQKCGLAMKMSAHPVFTKPQGDWLAMPSYACASAPTIPMWTPAMQV